MFWHLRCGHNLLLTSIVFNTFIAWNLELKSTSRAMFDIYIYVYFLCFIVYLQISLIFQI